MLVFASTLLLTITGENRAEILSFVDDSRKAFLNFSLSLSPAHVPSPPLVLFASPWIIWRVSPSIPALFSLLYAFASLYKHAYNYCNPWRKIKRERGIWRARTVSGWWRRRYRHTLTHTRTQRRKQTTQWEWESLRGGGGGGEWKLEPIWHLHYSVPYRSVAYCIVLCIVHCILCAKGWVAVAAA